MARKKATAARTAEEPTLEKGSTKKRFSNVNSDTIGHDAKRTRIEDRTDFSRWRLRDDESRHTWQYLEDDQAAKEWPQTYADKYFLGLPLVRWAFHPNM
jgi:lanosterol synthase